MAAGLAPLLALVQAIAQGFGAAGLACDTAAHARR
jgi:hypothetical protein